MSFPTVAGRAVEGVPYREAQMCLGPAYAIASYQFFLSGTSTPTNVYQDGALTTPFPITGVVSADNYGRFPPIYLNTAIVYRVRFYDSTNTLRWTVDPYTAPLATVGTSALTAYGITVAPTGEVAIPAPNTGGTGVSLTLKAGALGSAPLQISSTLPGNSALIVNSSATVGGQTATFTATNKPGTATSSPAGWLPITCDGVQYYAPIWHGNNFTPYIPNPSALGEMINGAVATFNGNGTTTMVNGTATPSNWFAPTTANIGAGYYINITKTGGLSGLVFTAAQGAWTNITSGGLAIASNAGATITGTYQLSTSVSGSPIVASGTISLSGNNGVQSVNYNGSTQLYLGGNGQSDLNGVLTNNWYFPAASNLGSGYWINITQTGGTSGFGFSAASGAWTNITNSGLAINISGVGGTSYYVTGTYIIASDSAGVNQLGSATITLSGGTLVQSPNWSGTTPLYLANSGAASLNGVVTSSWYAPNTANVGSGYWIDIARTGGTSGVNFSAAQGSWTNISNAGLNIDMTGYTGDFGTVTVTGNYQISNSSSGTPVLGGGTVSLSITLPNVQSTNWSGSTPLFLAGDGTATLNSAATTRWYGPTTSNIGSSYWINITRTSGTSGVTFSAAQGAWVNISNSGLTIDMSGTSGDVGTVTLGGTYQISSSPSGSPVLGSGSIALTKALGTLTRTYTTGTSATETVPNGATTVVIEAFGAGGGGGGGRSGCSGNGGGGGGGGGYVRSSYACSGGQTIAYTVPAGGTNGGIGANGGNGSGSVVASGTLSITTMTAPGGGGGIAGSSGGAGGAAGATGSGGNVANSTGNTGGAHAGCVGGAGGAGVTGVNGYNGLAGGTGGPVGSLGLTGGTGRVVFKYS